MRRSLSAFLSVALCAALVLPMAQSAEIASAATVPQFTITGTGYGHGIGMSQYGAQGYALKGYDFSYILRHYFKGTVIGTASTKNVSVNLDPTAKYSSASVGYNAGYTRTYWTVRPGSTSAKLSIGGTAHDYGTYKFTGNGTKIDVTGGDIDGKLTFTGQVTVKATAGSPPLVQVVEPTGIYSLGNCKYRGSLTMVVLSGKLKMLNVLNIEDYLKGVVPRESPSGWKPEALKAQAVAARSYAYIGNGELYCTTSSQAYQGYGANNSKGVWVGEVASTNSAVDATRGKVVKYGSTIIQTFFFSQSGGRTANIEDVWVGATPQPYYKSVDDPYENLAGATKCPWPASDEKHLDGTQVAAKLRAASIAGVPASPAYVTGVSVERASSGYPKYVTFRFNTGATVRPSGWTVRSAFGLLSPMFYFSGFPMSRIYGANRYATAEKVSRSAFATTAPAAVVASGQDFADALTGSGVAGALTGSLLLTYRDTLPAETSRELARLKPATVYLMGGTSAISSATEGAVKRAVPGAVVKRIAGRDRYETAANAADVIAAIGVPRKMLLVSGTSWPDAAAASALAYANKYPILLTRQAALDPKAAAVLTKYKPAVTIIAGGTAVVSKAVSDAAAAKTGGTAKRLAGADRYSTSSAIARYLGTSAEGTWSQANIYLATGGAFPDALTGGVLAGKNRNPMLLTMPNGIANATKFYLQDYRAKIQKLWVFGGSVAVTNRGYAALDSAMIN